MEVYIGECSSYSDCVDVIEHAFLTLGGTDKFVGEGETILVKPNLLKGATSEKAVTTHPDFIIAVVKTLEKEGAHVIVGDSPGGTLSDRSLRRHYEKAGWDRIEEETGARLNYDITEKRVSLPDGRILKSIPVLSVVDDVDGVVNLPKLKTHSLTVFTGAVKNLYGVVPGLTKSAFHGQYRGIERFSKVLLDVKDVVNTRISIMDGILGMEGAGPSNGQPIDLNMVLASESEVCLDISACLSVGIPPRKVTTIKELDDVPEITYPNLTPKYFDYKMDYPEGGSTPWWAPESLGGVLSNLYLKRPKLDELSCDHCGKCNEICPQDAIKQTKSGPKISWWKCMRCYCCAEVCPNDALTVE